MREAMHFSDILVLASYVLVLVLYFQFSDIASIMTTSSARTFLNLLYSLKVIYFALRKSFYLNESFFLDFSKLWRHIHLHLNISPNDIITSLDLFQFKILRFLTYQEGQFHFYGFGIDIWFAYSNFTFFDEMKQAPWIY